MRWPKLTALTHWQSWTALQWALMVSVTVHLALLTVQLGVPEAIGRAFRETGLEVILINARSNETPEKPQAIAQLSLAGGGEAERGRATSPLPAAQLQQSGESADEARRRISQMQQEQQQLLAQLRRELAILPAPDPQQTQGSPQEMEQDERRRQLLRLLAEIEKRVNNENARPKKRYISPATQEAVYALYYDNLRRRIETRGTRDFPEYNGQKLYGELTMNVTIDSRGQVVDTEILLSSKSRRLDSQAMAIVRAAGPFGSFSQKMRQQADQIVVTSRFRFSRDEGLEAIPLIGR